MIYCGKWDDAPNIPDFALHRSTIGLNARILGLIVLQFPRGDPSDPTGS